MKGLELSVVTGASSIPLQFRVKRMVNGGYVGRDVEAVKAHLAELSREGVPAPPSVPMIFPVLSDNITADDRIEVIGNKTSGEAEFVLLFDAENIFVGVGSDHTDRELERESIVMSKQVCPNVLSPQVWKYDDVEEGWDDLTIQGWVKPRDAEEWLLYQKAPLGTIISARDLIGLVKPAIKDGGVEGLVIFSGTVPILTREMVFGSAFRAELIDARRDRKLRCEYRVVVLDYLKGY
ncbi:MAG TPA: DUF2848 family protein [Syntrophorhabdales bacterium]|nr:DUF2848 family protein [Syntrophorhabdales bacterium]